MAVNIAGSKKWVAGLTAAALVAGLVPAPASAQSDRRLEQIESQLRALQRAVFPGGDERFFEPEINPNAPRPQEPVAGTVSTSAMTDVLARLEAMETQLARLTAATEVNQNALNLLEIRLNGVEEEASAAAASAAAAAAASSRPSASNNPPQSGVIDVPDTNGAELAPAENQASAPASPSPARLAAVQAIAKPATGDRGDDEYSYGFRLWDAGFYPEAQQQLAMFVEQYPDHWRTTYGRNLLGRAFLDAGDARRAATHFFDNYQDDKTAERAPDSLLYLAESMIQLGDTRRACIALAEFGDTYPALATGRLQTQYDTNRSRVDCE